MLKTIASWLAGTIRFLFKAVLVIFLIYLGIGFVFSCTMMAISSMGDRALVSFEWFCIATVSWPVMIIMLLAAKGAR